MAKARQLGLFDGASPDRDLGQTLTPFGRDVAPAAATPEDVESRQRAIRTSAPYQRHSDTSHEAAEAIEPASDTLRGAVLCVLRGHPDGMTDEEIQNALDMNANTERPRRVELLQSGMIEDSGERRHTQAGRRAVVWIVSAKGA